MVRNLKRSFKNAFYLCCSFYEGRICLREHKIPLFIFLFFKFFDNRECCICPSPHSLPVGSGNAVKVDAKRHKTRSKTRRRRK